MWKSVSSLVVVLAFVWYIALICPSSLFWIVFTIDALFDNERITWIDNIKTSLAISLEAELQSNPITNYTNLEMPVDEYYINSDSPNDIEKMANLVTSYRSLGKPFVIRKFINNSYAMNGGWTQDSFINRFINDNYRYEYSFKMDKKQFRAYVGNFTFSEGFTDMKNSNKWQFISDEIFRKNPELFSETNLDSLHKLQDKFSCEFFASILFWGYHSNRKQYQQIKYFRDIPPTKRIRNLHCDGTDDFYSMVAGSKIWYLVESKYTKYMRPWITSSLVVRSLQNINITNNYIPHYVVQLFPGDLLYVPPYAWHSVHSLPNENNISVGIANRCVDRKRDSLFKPPNVFIESLTELKYDPQYYENLEKTWSQYVLHKFPLLWGFIPKSFCGINQNATTNLDGDFCKKQYEKGCYCYSTSTEVGRVFRKASDEYDYYLNK
eukprot:407205_1